MNEYSKYLILKSSIEDLFGTEAWYALKESNHLPTWRKYAERTLKAIELSIKDTVEIYDNAWLREVEENIQRGVDGIKSQKSIDEIIAALAGSLRAGPGKSDRWIKDDSSAFWVNNVGQERRNHESQTTQKPLA